MQFRKFLICFAFICSGILSAQAQNIATDSTFKRYFVGSSMFMLANIAPSNRPDFVQLNLGYRLTKTDVVSLEFKTWKYAWPLGIPYGPSFEAPEEEFPGYIREFGVALAYQHYWWKGLYSAIHIMSARQYFVDDNGKNIDKGFQFFNTYRLIGYHFKLFNNRCFIEPSIAITHRPFHTSMPENFKQLDSKWPKYLFPEPGLHFGFNF